MDSQQMAGHITFESSNINPVDLPQKGGPHQSLWFRGGPRIHGTLKMKSHPGTTVMLLPLAFCLSLIHMCGGAAIPITCGSIYKSFAQCLVALGDSLVETQKEQSTQDIDAVCKSWNTFHVCANSALAGCPGEAAAIWESLRQESRKAQFSGNLYDMCASRTTLPPSTVPAPPSPPTSDQTNQETLKGRTDKPRPFTATTMLPVLSTILVCFWV